jgi:hypothetical protein
VHRVPAEAERPAQQRKHWLFSEKSSYPQNLPTQIPGDVLESSGGTGGINLGVSSNPSLNRSSTGILQGLLR